MTTVKRSLLALALFGVTATATPALAQMTSETPTTDTYNETDRDNDGFPWGLLGLLGLAGLIPRKRHDDHDTHRSTTTGGTTTGRPGL